MNHPLKYRGRFAPSPTGQLHFGSLVTAVASYLEAKVHQGEWLLRIDDLDQTRFVDGMDSQIMRTLEAFGVEWDEPVRYQSQHVEYYQAAFEQLQSQGHIYFCDCSRKQIAVIAQQGLEGAIYPGTCLSKSLNDQAGRAARIKTNADSIAFNDGVFGLIQQNIAEQIGDFVVRRADGFFAYQLAVVVDDQISQVNQVVRGGDLLDSTQRQIYLQQLLGYSRPSYAHIPLVKGVDGKKLSKSDQARPVDPAQPLPALLSAWEYLGQNALAEIDSVAEYWQAAAQNWQISSIHL